MKAFLIISGNSDENNSTQTVERHESSWGTENPRFTYQEIRQMTQNFKCEIGKGGFGPVYLGNLRNGTRVAVKVLSSSSSQGNREFHAEVTECKIMILRPTLHNMVPSFSFFRLNC